MALGAREGPGAGLADGDLLHAARAVGALGDHDGPALPEVGGRDGGAAEVAGDGVLRAAEAAQQALEPELECHPAPITRFLATTDRKTNGNKKLPFTCSFRDAS